MEETAVVSMEFVLVALVALAVLLGIIWYAVSNRTREFDQRITKLEEENARLSSLVEAYQAETKKQEEMPKETSYEKESDTAFVQHPMVSVGNRHPVVVPARPIAVVPKTGPVHDTQSEIVAVIMAAVAACGYSPAAIRSIRPVQRHHQNWVMAGRLANMK